DAAAIVECHRDLRGITNGKRLPVRARFQRERRWKSGRGHATVLNQNPRRVETGEDRLLFLRGWGRNAGILTREIIPDNALTPERSLPLRFVLRSAVCRDLLI